MVNNKMAFRNAVSVFYRFSMWYCGFSRFFFHGIAVLGTPNVPLQFGQFTFDEISSYQSVSVLCILIMAWERKLNVCRPCTFHN